ncbi:hypothetical protein MNBD_ALPHA02-943 [hydrothermal vent metagenome]|uniref:Cell wall hydrolase SleB domain-containing protein n=1 Tax=hydrothermal vent metagenome TaxID=652676 RepID=A0A3B0R2L6_9ZZZZ
MKHYKLVIKIVPVVVFVFLLGLYLLPQTEVEASIQPDSALTVDASLAGPASVYDEDIDVLLTQLPGNVSAESFRCLAQAVYFEARSEPFEGQVAVAYVILNRVKDRRYPDNICGVVFQNEKRRNQCQFSFACDGLSDNPYEKTAWNVARRVAGGTLTNASSDVTARSTHYHAKYVHPGWAKHLQPTLQVGSHIFYREDL